MTEQDYEKLVSEASEHAWNAEVLKGICGPSSNFDHGFLAGVAFARANPAPEVLELVEALERIEEETIQMDIHSLTIYVQNRLTRFKERGRG